MIRIKVHSVAGHGKENEDAVKYAQIAPDVFAIAVADGMGGRSSGAQASQIAADSVVGFLIEHYVPGDEVSALSECLAFANEKIKSFCENEHVKAGASIATMIVSKGVCFFSWLGDVRIYHHRDNVLRLLTQDHLAIADNHSFLTRCLNGRPFRYESPVISQQLIPMDILYISTDGYYLHNMPMRNMDAPLLNDDDSTMLLIEIF